MFSAGWLRQAKLLLNENSTTILTSMGVAGTVSTAYLSGRASLRAARVIDTEKLRRDPQAFDPGAQAARARLKARHPDMTIAPLEVQLEFKRLSELQDLSRTDKVKLVWFLYLPAVAAGGITITSIVFAHRIDAKKIAALTVASGISERALQEYKAKVVEKLGERQHTKIKDEIAQDQVNARPPRHGEVIITGAGEVLCYDQITGRYFYSTVEEIRKAENKLNHDILNYDGASLAEFHDMIGLESTSYTNMVGWNTDNLVEVEFSTTMTKDEKPCLVVGFNYPPTPAYTKLH